MATLLGPPRSASPRPVRPMTRPGPVANLGPMWTRPDWYVLSGLTAAVIVVVGLLMFVVSLNGNPSKVQATPAPTTTTFSVASGAGKSILCGEGVPISVGGTQATVEAVDGDQITLTQPLVSPPASGAVVSQSVVLPVTVGLCGAVASSPKPTTTEFTLTGGAGVDFGTGGVLVGGQTATIKLVDPTTYRITLSSPLNAVPTAGTPVSQQIQYAGSLIQDVVSFALTQLSVIIVAVAALVARPVAARLRRKPRPRVMETLVFGAVIAVVNTLILFVAESALGPTSLFGVVTAELTAAASGFVLVPLVYPTISRMFRRTPRQVASTRTGR
jgi:hypothetical protein